MIIPAFIAKFDRAKLAKLKEAHAKATGDEFGFEGQILLKSYAGYLIEYLTTKLG